MDKTKCITFDPVAQEALPDHIKAKMKANRETARQKICACCGWPAEKFTNEGLCDMCESFGNRESVD